MRYEFFEWLFESNQLGLGRRWGVMIKRAPWRRCHIRIDEDDVGGAEEVHRRLIRARVTKVAADVAFKRGRVS